MKEKINRLARGIFENEIPELEYPERIDELLAKRGISRGEFYVRCKGSEHIKGLCYSDNMRVVPEVKSYIGSTNRIFYTVDASFAPENSLIEGNFFLVTSAGEFTIPYSFRTPASTADKNVSGLLKKEDMRALYNKDAEKLLLLFECDDFVKAPFMDNERLRCLYDGLRGRGDRMHAMRQFMYAAGIIADTGEDRSLTLGDDRELTHEQEFLINNIPDDEELLTELCRIMIRGRVTEPFAYHIYEKAIRLDIKLTQLYEYYLYSYPEGCKDRMPKEVLMYFSYDSGIDKRVKAPVYKNILTYMNPDTDIYRRYEDEMRDYALESVFKNRIDENLAVIYDRMIYRDMIDRKVAAVFPSILKTCLIECREGIMRQVTVRYPQLMEEEVYRLNHGRAYVPVYFEDAVILFTDVYGNRYADVKFTKTPVLTKPDLLRRCFDVYSEHPMLKISAAKKIVSEGIKDMNGKAILEDVMKSFDLNPVFRKKLVSRLIHYKGNTGFLSKVRQEELSDDERRAVFSDLVSDPRYREAYIMLRKYGTACAEASDLCEAVNKLVAISSVPDEEREFFLGLCFEAFKLGARGPELLDFLCREYEGPTESMYLILTEAVRLDAYTHDLCERLLAAQLFSGSDAHIDEVFKYYLEEGDAKENLIKAYLTARSSAYFVDEKRVAEGVFDFLESILSDLRNYEKAPTVYLLALTKHYSEKKRLNQKQRKLCSELMEVLISEDYIFYYTKRLGKLIDIPVEIKNKYYIEYHGSKYIRPVLYVRIKPEDTDFRKEEMRRVYQGIYVKDMVLFSDDELNYMIYDSAVSDEPVEKGMISGKQGKGEKTESRASKLDEITALSENDEKTDELRESMLSYAIKNSMNEELFKIKDYETIQ